MQAKQRAVASSPRQAAWPMALLLLSCVGQPAGDDGGVTDGPRFDAAICPAPLLPSDPYPPDEAHAVATESARLDWSYDPLATGYDVYLGSCPVPDYPNSSFTPVSDSSMTGLSLTEHTTYCWQVVAHGDCGSASGPVWRFETACAPEDNDAPLVTSPTAVTFPADQPSGSYRLSFDQEVANVAASLTWSAQTGSGSLQTVTQIDGRHYEVSFSGVADGDAYTLEVATTVVDTCGIPLAAPVDIELAIGCWPQAAACEDGDLCTTGEQCVAGACVGGPLDCSDSAICTIDEMCDSDTGQCQATSVTPAGQPAPGFVLKDANQHSASYGIPIDPITEADQKVRVLALHGCT